ncbi:recombination protein F [Aquisphaera giovannonii]|uniref:Recombination protein F n=1 Tax=Aquisphaera giovannonii TaxID=406548 RepID=A0A5B9VVV5_9BACT|nr:ATP-binding protein [Aquisphaera giovannonii]QEH31991.1 recombination protein F [Aquisphaera giovannonii]
MIRKVRVQNYKSLRDVSVDLERFTVFVGANGSGKTSILQAVHNTMRAASRSDADKVFVYAWYGDWIYTRGGQGEWSIECEMAEGRIAVRGQPPLIYPPPPDFIWIYTRGGQGEWSIECEMAEGRIAVRGQPPLIYPPPPDFIGKSKWRFPLVIHRHGALDDVYGLVLVRLDASLMARPSYSQDDPPRMASSGRGLASVLAFMALNDPQGFARLVEMARILIPRLRRIRFRKEPVYRTESELVRFGQDAVKRRDRRKYQGELILFDFDHAENVSARHASEGTILMLGLLTILLGPSRPRVMLLDDLEHGLHPLAQKQMVEVIGQILQQYPDLQILATAHSPYLLNFLSPEQVRIVALGEDGHTRCGRLSDHPEFETWKEEMAPGEMWSLFGEKWLAEQEPAR